jgi:hypothetical protein
MLRTARRDAVAEEFWSKARPGHRLLLWFSDDDVWHEVVFCWRVSEDAAVIHTPDGHTYHEYLHSKLKGYGAQKVVFGGPGPLPRGLGGRTYRFSEALTEGNFKKILLEGAREARRLAGPDGMYVTEYQRCINHEGDEVSFKEYVEGASSRRLSSKGRPLGTTLFPDRPKPLALVLPAGGPAGGADGGELTPRADWRTAEDDRIWVVAELGKSVALGTEVMPSESAVSGDNLHNCLSEINRQWVRLVKVKESEVQEFIAATVMEVQKSLKDFVDEPEKQERTMNREKFKEAQAAGSSPKGEPAEEATEEIRTLPVSFDAHGERHRLWREVANSVESDVFPDWPLEGPRTMMWLVKFWSRQGGGPVAWLEKHLQTESYSVSDRSVHELRALAEVIEMAGTYDQLNLAALASFELLARRWQLILAAHSKNPSSPDYDGSEYFEGLEKRRFGIAPSLQEYVSKKMKDDAEIEKQKSKARELRSTPKAKASAGKQ